MAVTESPQQRWVPGDSFGNRLALVRNSLGMTQREAADACGLDDGSWSNWERGAKPRGMDGVVKKIAENLKVDRDWLMWGGPLGQSADGTPRIHALSQPDQMSLFVSEFCAAA